MFEIPPQQFHQLRKNALAKALVETFSGTAQQGSIDPITGDVLATDLHGHSLRFGFDEQGFIGTVKSPLGRVWRLNNDPQGRLQALTNPAGLKTGLNYDVNGRLVSIDNNDQEQIGLAYDTVGNLSRIAHADGSVTELRYQAPSQLVGKTDRLGHNEHYRYDDEGRLIAITNANGQTTEFDYGDWDRPDRARFPNGHVEEYTYDTNGRVQRIANQGGATVTLDYAGNAVHPAHISYDDGEVLEFVRDDQGRILQAKNAQAIAQYQYDGQGRVTLEDVNGAVIRYHYNDLGSLVGLTYPSGETVRFGYDADLRLDTVNDWNGGVYAWGYDGLDRAHAVAYPSGLETHIWQTPTGRIQATDVLTPAGSRLFGNRYRYDAEDRLQENKDTTFGMRNYTYDSESRLLAVEAEKSGLNEYFAYDPNGNRTECNGGTAEFDTDDRLLRQGHTYCDYDAQGKLAVLQSDSSVWRYTWNSRGLLLNAESDDGHNVTFAYDAFGRRLWKRSVHYGQTSETRFFWAGEHLIGDETSANSLVVRRQAYLYQPGTYIPLATRIDGQVFHYHCDPLGTPRRLTDSQGRIVWEADMDAFGAARMNIEDIANPLRFPGQYFDSETGLHYNRFRYYSPELGRYLSRDPLGFLAGCNFFAYVDNNPINGADPLGLFGWNGALSFAGAAIAGIAVGALVVAIAPAALAAGIVTAAAIVLGGIAAGAVGYALNEGLENGWNLQCVLKAAGKGALVGFLSSLPFLLLPATASVTLFAGVGGVSGAIGYISDWALNGANLSQWSWENFEKTVLYSALTAGTFRFILPKIAAWRGKTVDEKPPVPPVEDEPVKPPVPKTSEKIEQSKPQSSSETPVEEQPPTTPLGQKPTQPPFEDEPVKPYAEEVHPNPSKTEISADMEEKILYGKRKTPSNELIGGHSPAIKNDPNYNVEVIANNPDGTTDVKFVTQYEDGNLSRIKKSTLAPDNWSNDKIIDVTNQVADSNPISVRARDGATLHRQTIDGVQWEVIKDSSGQIISSYPTGGKPTITF